MKNQRDKHKQQNIAGGNNFLVSIRYQENHSWQGTVQWLETGETLHFRSELELLNLIQDGVRKNQKEEQTHRTWNSQEGVSRQDAL